MTGRKDILLDARGLTIGHRNRTLYSGADIRLREGDCVMLCGANGSGKTTLLKMLAEMKDSHGGEIVMIPSRVPKVQGFTLREFVRISCYRQSDLGGRLSSGQEARIDGALASLGLEELSSRDISTLSDGEFQKGSIASALVRQASVMLLDEPTAFLDAENRIGVLKTLRALCETPDDRGSRPAIIFSTHDLHDGLAVCNKVMALGSDGKVRTGHENLREIIKTIFKDHSNDNQI